MFAGRHHRILALALVAVSLAAARAAGAAFSPSHPRLEPPGALVFGAPPSGFGTGSLSHAATRRLAAAPWWGGTYTVAGGETVAIYVSAAYPVDEPAAQHWADFFASLVHGGELHSLVAYFAPLGEVRALCGGAEALGCYGGGRLVVVGDSTGGVPPAFVATHEYGHHVAANRSNAPWAAIDWGAKRWATAARVCERAATGTAFPGDEGLHYSLNPGEAFAESYRVLNEKLAGATSAAWPIVDPSFFPAAAELDSLRRDVLDPWHEPAASVVQGSFRKGGPRVWVRRVPAPLDGDLRIMLRLPAGVGDDVALVAGDRTVATGLWSGSGEKSIDYRICGARSFVIRVTRRGPPGRFALELGRP